MAPTAARIFVAHDSVLPALFLILHAQRHGAQKSERSLVVLYLHSLACEIEKR